MAIPFVSVPRTADGGLLPELVDLALEKWHTVRFQCRERLMGDCY